MRSHAVVAKLASSPQLLTAEQRFNEGGGAIAWQATNATAARSTDFAHEGSSSIKVTATASAQVDFSLVTRVSVAPGDVVTGSIWAKNSVNHYGALRAHFYDAGSGLLSSELLANATENLSAWYLVSGTAPAAPANTVTVDLIYQSFAITSGDILYFDDASLTK